MTLPIPEIVFKTPEEGAKHLSRLIVAEMRRQGLNDFEIQMSTRLYLVGPGEVARFLIFDHLGVHGFSKQKIQTLIELIPDEEMSAIEMRIILNNPEASKLDFVTALANEVIRYLNMHTT